MSESLHSDPPRALHTPAGSPSRRSYRGCGREAQRSSRGLPPLLRPPALPAARSGVQDQGRHQEALQGLLLRKEARPVVHLLQNEPKAQAEADVAPFAVKSCKLRPSFWEMVSPIQEKLKLTVLSSNIAACRVLLTLLSRRLTLSRSSQSPERERRRLTCSCVCSAGTAGKPLCPPTLESKFFRKS